MKSQEGFKQADYDMETAEFMFNGGRYFYTVFMCHMAIEKAFKGMYHERLKELPPKTHNLLYLLIKIKVKPEETMGKFITKLNEASVATRYPENLEKLQKAYTKKVVRDILERSSEVLTWIKEMY